MDRGRGTKLSLDRARSLARDVYVTLGAGVDAADTAADALVAADRFGIDSHGLARLGYYAARIQNGVARTDATPEVISEAPTSAVVDGHHGLGPVVAAHAMRIAIEKARRFGLGAAAVRRSNHFGIAAHYALMATREGLIGLASTNARPAQAPTGGTAPLFGTNPIAFAAPSDEKDPFVFDAALSIVQRGFVELWRRRGERLPEGLAIDAEGRPATDASALLAAMERGEGALLPLGGAGTASGGHKGFGLSIVVEILCAALSDGRFLSALGGGDRDGAWRPYHTGHFFLAINPAMFAGEAALRRVVGGIARELRAARRAPGVDRIYVAGEIEMETRRERERAGVPIPRELRVEIRKLLDELGVDGYSEI